MKTFLKRAAAVLLVALLLFVSVFVFWASDASPANETALQALNSDSETFVTVENGWATFYPADNPRPETGFIFYPGGKVDYRAYAPALRMIAQQGYFVVVMPVPLNLALLDVNAAARVQAQYPEIKNWFVGGHSLGGVAASVYAGTHPDIRGVVLWASTAADDALKTNAMPTLSIYGTNDALFTAQSVIESRALLPDDARFIAIEGGNHGQFGSYGLQAGDNAASITSFEQWTQAANATVEFFVEVLK